MMPGSTKDRSSKLGIGLTNSGKTTSNGPLATLWKEVEQQYKGFVEGHNKLIKNKKEAVKNFLEVNQSRIKDCETDAWVKECEFKAASGSNEEEKLKSLFNECLKFFKNKKSWQKAFEEATEEKWIEYFFIDKKDGMITKLKTFHEWIAEGTGATVSGEESSTPTPTGPRSKDKAGGSTRRRQLPPLPPDIAAVENFKKQLGSIVNKYNEFVETHNKKLMTEEGVLGAVVFEFFGKSNDKVQEKWRNELDFDTKIASGNMKSIKTLGECMIGWNGVVDEFIAFLPGQAKEEYEKAVEKIRERHEQNETVFKNLGKDFEAQYNKSTIENIEQLRFLARKIFRYMQNVQAALLTEVEKSKDNAAEQSSDSIDVGNYLKLETDELYNVKTEVAEVTTKVKECFRDAMKQFISKENKVVERIKVKDVIGKFESIGDKAFYQSLKAALKSNKLKNWSLQGLAEKEKEKRAAMGVLFISMTYFKNSYDVINACKGLQDGGIKSGSSTEFIENAAAVCLTILAAAKSKVTGKDLILNAVKTKAMSDFTYFIKDINNTPKEIINIFDSSLVEQPSKKQRSLVGRAIHKVEKRAKSAKKAVSSRIKRFFGKSKKGSGDESAK